MDPNFTASDVDSAVPAVGPTTPNNAEPNAHLMNDILEKIRQAIVAIETATATAEGLIKLATDSAVENGVGSNTAVTPESLVQSYARLSGGANADFTSMPFVGGDAIVDSGTNANGYYAKFADGTLFMSKVLIFSSIPANSITNQTWNFPTTSHTTINATGSAQSGPYFESCLVSPGTGLTSCTVYVRNTNPSSPTGQVGVVVNSISRWKQ